MPYLCYPACTLLCNSIEVLVSLPLGDGGSRNRGLVKYEKRHVIENVNVTQPHD